uniref:Uncharacterized protein n=1 Tax=Mola mola TaxID=94237 RepID=A0A3Q3VNC3_MOLML
CVNKTNDSMIGRNNITIFGMAVAYIINIFLSVWLVKYVPRAGKFLHFHSFRHFRTFHATRPSCFGKKEGGEGHRSR